MATQQITMNMLQTIAGKIMAHANNNHKGGKRNKKLTRNNQFRKMIRNKIHLQVLKQIRKLAVRNKCSRNNVNNINKLNLINKIENNAFNIDKKIFFNDI